MPGTPRAREHGGMTNHYHTFIRVDHEVAKIFRFNADDRMRRQI